MSKCEENTHDNLFSAINAGRQLLEKAPDI